MDCSFSKDVVSVTATVCAYKLNNANEHTLLLFGDYIFKKKNNPVAYIYIFNTFPTTYFFFKLS